MNDNESRERIEIKEKRRGGRAQEKRITMSNHSSSFGRINRIDIFPKSDLVGCLNSPERKKLLYFTRQSTTVPGNVGKGENPPVIELPSHWIRFHPRKYFHAQLSWRSFQRILNWFCDLIELLVSDGQVSLISRSFERWTAKLPLLLPKRIPVSTVVIRAIQKSWIGKYSRG